MASVVTDPNGRRRVSYKVGRKRHTLRLGEVSEKFAGDVADKIQRMISCLAAPQLLSIDVLEWVAKLPDKTYKQLTRAGLVPPRETTPSVTLTEFLTQYFDALRVKPGTKTHYGHTRRCMLQFFGAQTDVLAIEEKQADQFHAWLATNDFSERELAEPNAVAVAKKLSPATVSRRIACARHIFNKAVRWKFIEDNPFVGIKAGDQTNPARKYFVPRETVKRAIDECADVQWQLIIALARYGGLRCPSEHLCLRWIDVNLERGTMLVHSPKTEHHPNAKTRIVPIFPELRPYLEAVLLDKPDEGAEYVITRYRKRSCNLRSQFIRILKRAGLQPWPKLFQNLRASRETELMQDFPLETACAWIGNSPKVAVVHYLNDPAKDDHFQRAVAGGLEQPEQATRIPTRTMGEDGGKLGNEETVIASKTPIKQQKGRSPGSDGWACQAANTIVKPGIYKGISKSDAQSDARGGGGGGQEGKRGTVGGGRQVSEGEAGLAEVAAKWWGLSPEQWADIMSVVRGTT